MERNVRKQMAEITFTDLFAGIGGFRLGLEKSGEHLPGQSRNRKSLRSQGNKPDHKAPRPKGKPACRESKDYLCVWSNEWDKYARQIYKKHWGECDGRDIRTVPSEEIPDHDLLCAGFPCQSFSVAGKRAGFEDTRGTLFFEIARIARDKRPRHLLLENVKGLLSHQAGETFQTILGILAHLGYRCEWQVLNSKDFGVPQNRERVFVVGHLGGEGKFQVFPVRKGDSNNNEGGEKREAGVRNAVGIDANDYKGADGKRTMIHNVYGGFGEKKFREFKDYSPTIRTPKGGGHLPLVIGNIYPSKGQAGQVFDSKGISKAIVPAKRGGSAVMPIIANAVDCDGYLRRGGHHDKPICHYRIRRLTPVECERLQGFPDNFTKGVSDTQRYKMLGNAVTTNVVEAIGRQLKEAMGA